MGNRTTINFQIMLKSKDPDCKLKTQASFDIKKLKACAYHKTISDLVVSRVNPLSLGDLQFSIRS